MRAIFMWQVQCEQGARVVNLLPQSVIQCRISPFTAPCGARHCIKDHIKLQICSSRLGVTYRKSVIAVRVDAAEGNERVVLAGWDGRPAAAVGLPVQCVPCLHP